MKLFIAALLCLLSPIALASSNAERVVERASKQVFMLTPPGNHTTGATGFELKAPSGEVFTITNAHVCKLAENGILAAQVAPDRWVNIHVLEISSVTDLCALDKVPGAEGLKMASSVDAAREAYALGHPYLRPLTLSSGFIIARENIQMPMEEEVTSKEACDVLNGSYQTFNTPFGPASYCMKTFDTYGLSLTIYPGNSGSPLMNSDAEVEGVIFAASSVTHAGSAVPFELLKAFISTY